MDGEGEKEEDGERKVEEIDEILDDEDKGTSRCGNEADENEDEDDDGDEGDEDDDDDDGDDDDADEDDDDDDDIEKKRSI